MRKMNINMVIVYKKRYFGIDFDLKRVNEISFKEAFGKDFFDWDINFCSANEENKIRYMEMRGQDGCGFGMIAKIGCEKNAKK